MIYLSGKINGSYRAQNILKTLNDNNAGYIYIPDAIRVKFRFRAIRFLINVLLNVITLPAKCLLIMSSSKLVILPMNNSWYCVVDAFLARVFLKDVILEFYISKYDSKVNDRKEVSPNSLMARNYLLQDKIITRLATKIVCLNNSEAKYYSEYMASYSTKKIIVIPLVVDDVKLVTQKKNDDGLIKYCWWGTFIPLHGLDKIIKSFAQSDNHRAELYIFGNSDDKCQIYIDLAKSLKVGDKVHFENNFSFMNKKLPKFLLENTNVVGLGSFGDSQKAENVLVNKVVDSSCLSIPSLTYFSNGAKEYFTHEESIIFCDNTIDSMVSYMNLINKGHYSLSSIGSSSRKVYENNFSKEAFTDKYDELLEI